MSQVFTGLPDEAFRDALLDANLIASDGTPLFSTDVFDIRLGGDSSINSSTGTFSLPLPKIVIAIGNPYGRETAYTEDDEGNNYVDCALWLPFTVYANTGADQRDVRKRLDYARDRRRAVFSSHGLTLFAGTVRESRQGYDPVLGLTIGRFGWLAEWGRTNAS